MYCSFNKKPRKKIKKTLQIKQKYFGKAAIKNQYLNKKQTD